MAVTVADLAIELRLPDSLDAQQTSVLTRLIGVGEAFVDLLISGAPEAIQDEVVIRLGAYLYEQPTSGRRDSYSNSWVNSGAGALASRWLTQTIAGEATLAPSIGGVGSGGIGEAAALALIQLWAREGNSDPIPLDKLANAAGAAHDDVARANALAAQQSIDALETLVASYEHLNGTEIGGLILLALEALHGNRVIITTSATNVAMDDPAANAGNILLEFLGTTLKAYRRLDTTAAPFWTQTATFTGGGGGFPMTRTQVLSASATGVNQTIQASEDWLPNQLYEIKLGAWTRHLFLTTESGSYAVAYNLTDQAVVTTAPPVDPPYFVTILTIGGTTAASFSLREITPGITTPVVISKLT